MRHRRIQPAARSAASTGRSLPRRCSPAIAERGADAVGYAHRSPGGPLVVHKQRTGASAVLERITIPADAHQVLLHVRDYTKGHPRIAANNHPVRHGAVVGVHNGTIVNDDELIARHGFERAEPGDDRRLRGDLRRSPRRPAATPAASRSFRGSMATAWLDERDPEAPLPRARRRPPALGRHHAPRALLRLDRARARDRRALHRPAARASASCRRARCSPLEEAPAPSATSRFTPDPTYEADPLPAVRAPQRGRVLPRAARRSCRGVAEAFTAPSRSTVTPSSRSRSRTRNWNVDHAPRRASNMR